MNLQLNEKIVYDKRGRKKDVIISYSVYQKLMELIEDIEDMQEMKEVESEATVSWDDAKAKLRRQGKL